MILFPAIDLKEGRCVRLKHGLMDSAKVYNDDPANQARIFEKQGLSWLHVVDLNGAFAGRGVNAKAIEAILSASRGKIQLGGGIRTLEDIEYWLNKGVARVILGTMAARDPQLVHKACRLFPDRIVVGIDAREGKVAVEGWAKNCEISALELAKKFEEKGVAAIVHTDIERDGVMKGINWPTTIGLADNISTPVIASGGLSSIADIVRITMPDAAKLEGVIAGRAIYDGAIDIKEALNILNRNIGSQQKA